MPTDSPLTDPTIADARPQPLWRYWTTDPPSGWRPFVDTAENRREAIAAGARFFTALALDAPIEDGREPRYVGPLYAEFDGETVADAHLDCISFLRILEAQGVDLRYMRLFASGGRGFHIEVPEAMLALRLPIADLPYVYREMIKELTAGREFPTLDQSVYSGGRGRMWRIPNLRRADNGRYKVPLTAAEVFHLSTEEVWALTSRPREVIYPDEEPSPVPALVEMFDRAKRLLEDRQRAEPLPQEQLREHMPACLQILASGKFTQTHGTFNRIAMTLAGYAVAAGMQEAEFLAWVRPLVDGFQASATYSTPRKREKHLRDEFRYAQENPKYARFSCAFPLALAIPEVRGCCASCELKKTPSPQPRSKPARSKPSPAAIGAMLLEKYRFIHAHGTLYVYRNGVYRPDAEALVRAEVQQILGDDARQHDGNEVVYWLCTATAVDADAVDQDERINVLNGLLDWRTGTLYPHSPDVLSTIQLPVYWDPQAYHARGDQFLDEVLASTETRQLLEEGVGYCLAQSCKYQKAFMLVGPGSNGKSTLLRWVAATLSRENVAAVSLQELAANRFRAAELVGKLANIYPDLPREALDETDIFKALVSGDMLTAERKFRDPFTFRNRAKLFFSANELPRTKDVTPAFFRRWIIIPFPRTFEGADCDPHLADTLESPEARAYLLRLAVEGLRRLEERGGFTECPDATRALKEYRSENDSVLAFLEDACELGNLQVEREALYLAYRRWCELSGCHPVAQTVFGRRLRLYVPGLDEYRPREAGRRVWYYIGLRLADPTLLEPEARPWAYGVVQAPVQAKTQI